MDGAAVNRSLTRISHEIAERNPGEKNVCVVGIKSRGTALADILAEKIRSLGVDVETAYLDVTNYRDDLAEKIAENAAACVPDLNVEGRTVIMVDDVLYTGRTPWADPLRFSSPCSLTEATGNCRLSPTMWAKTFPPRGAK